LLRRLAPPNRRSQPWRHELTAIPGAQMVTELATGVQAKEVPDLVSLDLIR
jgi:hypothetical protein